SIKTSGFTIKYVNLENSAEKEYEGNATTYNYKDTTQLYTPTAKDSNHVFVGWTLDKSGEGAIYKNIPIDLYGDVTMYAVWDVPQASVTKESIISAESDGAFSKEYSQGSSLTMRGDISVTSMTSPVIQYKWHKNGDTTILGTSSTYSISNVSETGDYVLDYVITDSVEPLWRHSGSTTAQHAEITPGQLFIKDKSFVIDSTTPEYMGKRLRDIKFSVTMIDSMSREVEGVASWQTGINQVKEGVNKEKITFTPTNVNYSSTGEYEVEFQAKYITLTFNMPDVSDTIVANMTYQQTYTTNNIVQSFYREYSDRLENNPRYAPLKNMTPMFDGVKITEYTGQYINVQTSQEIEVEFVDATYTVTFDPDNGEKPFTNTSPIYYNNRITPPDIPVNEDKLFLGWYFDDITVDSTGATVTTNRAWNFDSDFVTRDLRLTAKWLDAVLELDSITVSLNKDEYTALTNLKAGDLTVTAYYKGNVDGYGEVEQEVELSFDQYSIEYENKIDSALHVGQGKIIVSYRYKGVTKTATETLNVVAVKVDTSGLDFGQNANNEITQEADGTPKNLPELDESEYINLHIDSIEYEYYRGSTKVEPEDVVRAGEYTVRVIFTTSSADYQADTLVLKLILGTFTEVTVVWDYDAINPYMYNGKAQAPTAKVYRSNGTEITNITLKYSGDTEVSARGNYTISVEIVGGSYKIIDGEKCDFSIVKAVLDAPTLKDDMSIVYDGSEKKFEDYFDIDTNLIEIASGGVG
ncbi:MAG: InlB B-repeat-containing protein, partial [Clostridia bacterium]|nr:InlB B-repeat-containing protein [Clostridia bacterium]